MNLTSRLPFSSSSSSYLRVIQRHAHLELISIHTSADATSGSTGKAGPEVALQPFGVVARLGQAAVLVQLPGANFAVAAAVQDHAHAGGALGHLQRTLTHRGAGGGGEDLYSQQQSLLETTHAQNSGEIHTIPYISTRGGNNICAPLLPPFWIKYRKLFTIRRI